MTSEVPKYTTKELSTKTWPDFERLFSQGSGWDFCACMYYQRGCHLSGKAFPTRGAARVQNLHEKRELTEQGRAHGILVYASGEPVGWCQYGPVDELPIPSGDRVANHVHAADATSQWRITCFVTHRKHRRKGVASVALGAALESIRKKGGGWVEATPIAHVYHDRRRVQLVKSHGRDSAEVEEHLRTHRWPETVVRGVGPVPAACGTFGSVSHAGTVSMFERRGFDAVKIVGDTHVLVRRHV